MCVPGNHDMEPGFGMHGYAGLLARVPIGGTSPLGDPGGHDLSGRARVGFIGLDSNDVSYEIPANRGWTRGRSDSLAEADSGAMRAVGIGDRLHRRRSCMPAHTAPIRAMPAKVVSASPGCRCSTNTPSTW